MKKQREVVLFLVKFFASYFFLFVIYSSYLQNNQIKKDFFKCDGITQEVAYQTSKLIEANGYKIDVQQHSKELSIKLIINGNYTARVIEGCNSVSVIILFLAFIIAFKGSLKNTLVFGAIGSLIIYTCNVLRIAFLTIMLYKFPDLQEVLHNLVFPAIIYGITFLLWVLWVYKFSDFKR